MSEPNPRESDLVLGGQNPLPVDAAILGGLAGVKQRLESESVAERLLALNNSIQYGSSAIYLALHSLTNDSQEVRRLAKKILRDRLGEAGKEEFLDRATMSYFITLNDWQQEIYNPEVGIVDPENNSYVVRMTNNSSWGLNRYDLSQFEALIQDPRVREVQALIFQIDLHCNDTQYTFGVALEAIIDARELFPNLRGLFIGQSPEPRQHCVLEYRKSTLSVFDIKDILISFPDLQILQIYGYFGEYILECSKITHLNLKTLIIESSDIKRENISQISRIELPNLEYFELWLTRACSRDTGEIVDALEPILATSSTPHLKYLGLCSCEFTNTLIDRLLENLGLDRFAVLDFKMGTMTDEGVKKLIKSSKLSKLKLLNISGNYLSHEAILTLNELACSIVNTHPGIGFRARHQLLETGGRQL
jgi:hypothetical protein